MPPPPKPLLILPFDDDEVLEEQPPGPWGIGVTRKGRTLRFSLTNFEDSSTKRVRTFARLNKGDQFFVVYPTDGTETVNLASSNGRAMVFASYEVSILKGAGRGVMGIKLQGNDSVMACELARSTMEGPLVTTAQGREFVVRERKFKRSGRAGRGRIVLKRGAITEWQRPIVLCLGNAEQEE